MNRTEKESAIEDLNKTFKTSTSVLLINFEGVNVSAQSDLRREVSKVESGYQVIKNRLALRAVEDTSLADLREHFQGPTAIAYTGGDPVALAKVLREFISDHPTVAFKAGVVEGKTFSASEVELLAKMPSRPELLSKLVYLLNAPLVRLATALQSPLRGLASVLKQLEEKKQADAPADAETKEQEAAAPDPEAQEAAAEEAAEEPVAEEPAAEEPVAEEAAAEEPVAEESAEAAAPEAAAEEEAGEKKENDKQE
jgi:large subunit ribosomal protein L10